jgi:predicted acyl esterase
MRRRRSWSSGSRTRRNDAFWQRGSVSTDYRRIQCPVYIVDGWVDTYVNTVTRILAT